jgi:DNA-3-methyladenine glycosylase II
LLNFVIRIPKEVGVRLSQISFFLQPLPPFRLDLTVWVLRRRLDNIWDRWDGLTYRRVFVLQENPLEVAVTQTGPLENSELKITALGLRLKPEIEGPLTLILERVLGLQTDLTDFYQLAEKDPKLKPLATKFRGVKPPRYPDVFEALVNAITCQQFTLTAGIRLLSRLVTSRGLPLKDQRVQPRAFPRPQDLTSLEIEDLTKLGFSRQKARSLIELARMIMDGGLDLEKLASLGDVAALESLTRLRGVGRWTAEYALLRGLGRVHIFPGDDVGVRNKLQSWLKVSKPLDYEGVGRILHRWKPYGGLIYFLLLLNGLDEQGFIETSGKGGGE